MPNVPPEVAAYSCPDTTVTTSTGENVISKEQAEADTDNAPDSTVDEKDLPPKVCKLTISIDQGLHSFLC